MVADGAVSWRFNLLRYRDVSGVSGTGRVAQGVVFGDGSVAVRWGGIHPSTAMWDSLNSVLAVHGHAGATVVEWIDEPPSAIVEGLAPAASATRAPMRPQPARPPQPAIRVVPARSRPAMAEPPIGSHHAC